MNATMLGLLSLGCACFWGTCTLAYIHAIPFVAIGAALAAVGLRMSLRDMLAKQVASAIPGLAVSVLGLLANAGLFAIAVIDM